MRRQGSQFAEDLALLQTQAVRCREILQKLTRAPSEPDPLHARMSVTQLIEEAAEPLSRLQRRARRRRHRPRPAATAQPCPEPVGERRPGVIYGLGNLVENAVDFAARARRDHRQLVGTRGGHHHRRRRPGRPARRHGCPGRALRHDPPGARRGVRQRMANPPAWAWASSSPRPCWSAPAPPSRSTTASARSTAPSCKISWPREVFERRQAAAPAPRRAAGSRAARRRPGRRHSLRTTRRSCCKAWVWPVSSAILQAAGGSRRGRRPFAFRPDELPEDRSLILVDDDRAFVLRLARAMELRGFEVRTRPFGGRGHGPDPAEGAGLRRRRHAAGGRQRPRRHRRARQGAARRAHHRADRLRQHRHRRDRP